MKTRRKYKLTPESIGEWLVEQQRDLFKAILTGAEEYRKDTPTLNLPAESLAEVSCTGFALQVALVAFTYHQLLDDSRYLSGGASQGVDINQFISRILDESHKCSSSYIKINTPDFDPFPVAGCIVGLDALFPKIIMYYSSIFIGLDPIEYARPDDVKFARKMVSLMKTTTPLAGTTALAYYSAFQKPLTSGGQEPFYAILRTWEVWVRHISGVQQRLLDFASDREVFFG